MSEENKKDAIDAEVTSETEVKSEKKKENGFSKLFNKAKTSFNNAKLESALEQEFIDGHNNTIHIFNKDELFPTSYCSTYTNIDKSEVIVYGKQEVNIYSVLINETDNNKAFYITGSKQSTIKLCVEGVEYERPVTLIELDQNVEEVNVIKAGKRYFIYKGKEE